MSKLIARVADMYKANVSKSLAKHGLKYDDLLVETASVQAAIPLLSEEQSTARTRRLVRAADCSLKRLYLPEDIQAIQKPLETYLVDHVKEAEERLDEREELTRW